MSFKSVDSDCSVKYGGKGANRNRTQNIIASTGQFTVADDEQNPFTVYKDENIYKRTENIISKKRPIPKPLSENISNHDKKKSRPRKDETQSICETLQSSSFRGLSEIVMSGHPDDLHFLSGKLSAHRPSVSAFVGLIIHKPTGWSMASCNRLQTWLGQLGFTYGAYAEKTFTYKLSYEKVDAVQRAISQYVKISLNTVETSECDVILDDNGGKNAFEQPSPNSNPQRTTNLSPKTASALLARRLNEIADKTPFQNQSSLKSFQPRVQTCYSIDTDGDSSVTCDSPSESATPFSKFGTNNDSFPLSSPNYNSKATQSSDFRGSQTREELSVESQSQTQEPEIAIACELTRLALGSTKKGSGCVEYTSSNTVKGSHIELAESTVESTVVSASNEESATVLSRSVPIDQSATLPLGQSQQPMETRKPLVLGERSSSHMPPQLSHFDMRNEKSDCTMSPYFVQRDKTIGGSTVNRKRSSHCDSRSLKRSFTTGGITVAGDSSPCPAVSLSQSAIESTVSHFSTPKKDPYDWQRTLGASTQHIHSFYRLNNLPIPVSSAPALSTRCHSVGPLFSPGSIAASRNSSSNFLVGRGGTADCSEASGTPTRFRPTRRSESTPAFPIAAWLPLNTGDGSILTNSKRIVPRVDSISSNNSNRFIRGFARSPLPEASDAPKKSSPLLFESRESSVKSPKDFINVNNILPTTSDFQASNSKVSKRLRCSEAKWRRISLSMSKKSSFMNSFSNCSTSPNSSNGFHSVTSSPASSLMLTCRSRDSSRHQQRRRQSGGWLATTRESTGSADFALSSKLSPGGNGVGHSGRVLPGTDGDEGDDDLYGEHLIATDSESIRSPEMLRGVCANSRVVVNQRRQTQLDGLHGQSFKAHVVGGTYLQWWEESLPVVSPPTATSDRVVGVNLLIDGTLELKLFMVSHKRVRIVRLGQHWVWLATSPDGYLVAGESILPGVSSTCYYLPTHPCDWASNVSSNASDNRVISLPSVDGNRSTDTSLSFIARHVNMNHSVCDMDSICRDDDQTHCAASKSALNSSSMDIVLDHSVDMSGGLSRTAATTAVLATQQGMWSPSLADGLAFTQPRHNQHDVFESHDEDNEDLATGIQYGSLDSDGLCTDEVGHNSPMDGASVRRRSLVSPELSFASLNIRVSPVPSAFAAVAMEEQQGGVRYVEPSSMDQRSVWSDAHVLGIVLDFLVDPVLATSANVFVPTFEKAKSSSKALYATKRQADETYSFKCACKTWALTFYRRMASAALNGQGGSGEAYSQWKLFMKAFVWGSFMARGACKEVYRVGCRSGWTGKRELAVSVMDVADLQKRGMEEAVARELDLSLVCSSLAMLNICPNLVQVHAVFRSPYPAPVSFWLSSPVGMYDTRTILPAASQMHRGRYQFYVMEFCSGGDLESHVQKALPSVKMTRSWLFQLCFALYCCREKLLMRHFDIKLLNVLVTSSEAALSKSFTRKPNAQLDRAFGSLEADVSPVKSDKTSSPELKTEDEVDGVPGEDDCAAGDESVGDRMTLEFGFGEYIFAIPTTLTSMSLVKLTDFGTSVAGQDELGSPITQDQFTTLENSPPEFLILGSAARQAFSADTFCLGLSFLHLLTGIGPYEELLHDVRCPLHLAQKLALLWEVTDENSPYFVVNEVLESLEPEEELETARDSRGTTDRQMDVYTGKAAVFCDTIYRYLVLFGVPEDLVGDDSVWAGNPIWTLLTSYLGLPAGVVPGGRGKKDREQCSLVYKRHCMEWSVKQGQNTIMMRVRDRLRGLSPGADDSASLLLHRMVHLHPALRCTMHEAITSKVFLPLRRLAVQRERDMNAMRERFVHYSRSPEEGGLQALPIL